MTITGQNDAPIANNDTITSLSEDDFSTILASTILANDTDPDTGESSSLSIDSITPVSVAGDLSYSFGGVIYSPFGHFESLAQGEVANDVFTYIVKDPHDATSAAGTVTVAVQGVNDDPYDLQISNEFIPRNEPIGTVVGILSVTDVDASDTRTR